MTDSHGQSDTIEQFRTVLRVEAAAILAVADRIGPVIETAIVQLRTMTGRVIFTGLGKAGYIARKAAATFCSTGSPAMFLHPSEALHGDLGMVAHGDVLIAISNSGETAEVLELLPHMARLNIPVIAITGNLNSSLALRSTIVLDAHVSTEADHISITPTSSTTVALVICDALAVTLMSQRGFTKEQFAIFHPGGNLGRKLLLTVSDLMRIGDSIPTISSEQYLSSALAEISAKKMGAVLVLDQDKTLIGILTDGDLRRLYQNQVANENKKRVSTNLMQMPVIELIAASCKTILPTALAAEAIKQMEDFQITVLPVVDTNQKLVGVIHLHDLIRAGLA